MLWPFNHFWKPRIAPRGTIEAIYGMIVTQAREPLFYQDLGVPDTVNGRFDLLVLHLWMVLRRLQSMADGKNLSQTLFDHFCDDMDANLREMGVGDLSVGRKMKVMWEAFHGRSAAYAAAMSTGDTAELDAALNRNVWRGNPPPEGATEALRRLVLAQDAHLATQDLPALARGTASFLRADEASR